MVSGDVVNTAARLQSAAPVNGILVGEQTYRATERAIEYRAAEAIVAKGKTEPIPVWEAVQARAAFGVDVRQVGGAPLVGREEELDVLVDALNRARRGRTPQLVTLVGVPGIGKSRLVWELFGRLDADPDLVTWRQGRSLPYGEVISFWALGEMAKAQAGILETDSPDEAERKLRALCADLVADTAERGWVESHLRPLVGLGSTRGPAATSATRHSRPGGDSSRRWRSAVHWCSSSKTCTGRTTAFWTSSTTSSTGRATSLCS